MCTGAYCKDDRCCNRGESRYQLQHGPQQCQWCRECTTYPGKTINQDIGYLALETEIIFTSSSSPPSGAATPCEIIFTGGN